MDERATRMDERSRLQELEKEGKNLKIVVKRLPEQLHIFMKIYFHDTFHLLMRKIYFSDQLSYVENKLLQLNALY